MKVAEKRSELRNEKDAHCRMPPEHLTNLAQNLSSAFYRPQADWHFDCLCKRCSDPTECGSFISAVKCFDCGADRVLPLDPLDYDSAWRCGRCGYSLGPRAVEQGGASWCGWQQQHVSMDTCRFRRSQLHVQFRDMDGQGAVKQVWQN